MEAVRRFMKVAWGFLNLLPHYASRHSNRSEFVEMLARTLGGVA